MTIASPFFQKREYAHGHDQPSLFQKSEEAYSHDHPFPFPDEEGELLRKTLCMVMHPPPFFRRRGDTYDHDHHFLFPEEGGCLGPWPSLPFSFAQKREGVYGHDHLPPFLSKRGRW